MSKILINPNYKWFFKDLKSLIIKRRNNALKVVNTELISLYWEIGERIVEKQKEANWWDDIIWQLSVDLEQEFWKWFSRRNLNYIRKFYIVYGENEKVHSLRAQITWTHHKRILDKVNVWDDRDNSRRLFYIKMSISQKWSVRDLERNLGENAFEMWALKQTNFKNTISDELQWDVSCLVKDSYDFSFLNLEEPFKEKKLEDLMVKSIDNTLKNFWTDFCFIWRQYKIEIEWDEYFIDLLFYNRKLKCFIVVELKVWDFKPEHSGKMAFYLSALESQEMQEGENPPIWIILVKNKNRTKVEYALKDSNKPMWVASYITKEWLPDFLVNILPSEDEINRELELIS